MIHCIDLSHRISLLPHSSKSLISAALIFAVYSHHLHYVTCTDQCRPLSFSTFIIHHHPRAILVPYPNCFFHFFFQFSVLYFVLRARKPKAQEKEALDIAFLLSPVVSLIMPSLTKDTAIIWWANAIAVGGCYAYAYLKPKSEGEEKSAVPEFISKGIKALDYGSGKERGERK